MDENEAMFAGFCGALAALSESYGTILLLCCSFIVIDLATGLAKAKIEGRINSTIGYKGFWRKTALVSALVFGMCLDSLMEYVAGPTLSSPIGRILGLYIAINECISICENLIACGVKMPKFVSEALTTAKSHLEQKQK